MNTSVTHSQYRKSDVIDISSLFVKIDNIDTVSSFDDINHLFSLLKYRYAFQ